MILSPINNSHTKQINSIYPNEIIEAYQKELGIDVAIFFEGISTVSLLECLETKYRFYYPFQVSGDSKFYEKLQKYDWYYMPWKWEHEQAISFISENSKVLEVGSGASGFVQKLNNRGVDVTGLELNEEMVAKAQNEGLKVYGQFIEEHAKQNPAIYDIVCSFQVLEHISQVRPFLEAQIRCLKKGGKLIICVPNNASFIKYSQLNILNMPPHHMGLWNKYSLTKLAKIFSLKVHKISYEPLQHYHCDWYSEIMEKHWLGNPMLKKLAHSLYLVRIFRKSVKLLAPWIKGHSIMIIFEKT